MDELYTRLRCDRWVNDSRAATAIKSAADQPHLIQPAAVIPGRRHLVEVGPVAERPCDQPGGDRKERPGAPDAADDERAEDEADQEDVAERIGEVGQYRRRVALGQPDQRGRKQGGADGRRGERADRPVEPAGER